MSAAIVRKVAGLCTSLATSQAVTASSISAVPRALFRGACASTTSWDIASLACSLWQAESTNRRWSRGSASMPQAALDSVDELDLAALRDLMNQSQVNDSYAHLLCLQPFACVKWLQAVHGKKADHRRLRCIITYYMHGACITRQAEFL